MRRLHVVGVAFWTTGIICWALDYAGCEALWEGDHGVRKMFMTWHVQKESLAPWIRSLLGMLYGSLERRQVIQVAIPNPQLHAWWHVCAVNNL